MNCLITPGSTEHTVYVEAPCGYRTECANDILIITRTSDTVERMHQSCQLGICLWDQEDEIYEGEEDEEDDGTRGD